MPEEIILDLQYNFFVVGERPFCFWNEDFKKRTLEFLENIDPSYFEYIADTHIKNIADGDEAKSKESQHAALVMRTTYSQALETLFALISAAVQAPFCIPAWINLYQNKELRTVVGNIHNHRPILSQTTAKILSWSIISEIIFECLVLEDKEKETAIKAGFAQFWAQLASDFLNDDFYEEYNSIKHGLRVHSGGFSVASGQQGQPSQTLLGKSEFGSSYLEFNAIGELKHHIQLKRHHRNWNPEDIAFGLKAVSFSISNVQAALKIWNGTPPDQIKFTWPIDLSAFTEPWKRSIQMGVTSMSGASLLIRPDFIDPFPKEKILANYKAGQSSGVRRLAFTGEADSSNEI